MCPIELVLQTLSHVVIKLSHKSQISTRPQPTVDILGSFLKQVLIWMQNVEFLLFSNDFFPVKAEMLYFSKSKKGDHQKSYFTSNFWEFNETFWFEWLRIYKIPLPVVPLLVPFFDFWKVQHLSFDSPGKNHLKIIKTRNFTFKWVPASKMSPKCLQLAPDATSF